MVEATAAEGVEGSAHNGDVNGPSSSASTSIGSLRSFLCRDHNEPGGERGNNIAGRLSAHMVESKETAGPRLVPRGLDMLPRLRLESPNEVPVAVVNVSPSSKE